MRCPIVRVSWAVAAASILVVFAAFPLAAQDAKASWAELKTAAAELGTSFAATYGAPLDSKSDDLARAATSVVQKLEAFRQQAVDSRTVGPADARTYIVTQGLLVGTAVLAPTVGLSTVQAVHSMVDGTLVPRLINEAQKEYQRNTAELVGAVLKATGDLDNLKASRNRGVSIEEVRQQAINLWSTSKPILSQQLLNGVPPDEQKAVFEKGVETLIDNLDKYGSQDLNSAPIGDAIKSVITVRSKLREIEEKHKAVAQQYEGYVAEMRRLQHAAVSPGQTNLESNPQWRQLGAMQRVEALKAGWFPSLPSNERQNQIQKLEVAAKIERVGSSIGIASDYAGGLLAAAQVLKVPENVQSAIENAKRNIEGAQNALGIAAQIAMGNYLGALGSFGGLMGGGGDSGGGQAAIMAALQGISQKLDEVIKLQKQTLEEVRGLRDQVQEFAISTSRRFNSIDDANFETISRLMQLRWQIEGSVKCQGLLQELVDHPTARQYDLSRHTFASYQARLDYFRGDKANDFPGCRGFFAKALTLDANGEVADYFQLRPEKQTLEELRKRAPGSLADKSLDFLLAHTLYFGMQAYHKEYLATLKPPGSGANCDAAFFHSLSSTPLRLNAYLSANRNDCSVAYKLSAEGRPPPSFTVMSAHQLDLYLLDNFANLLEMFMPFRLFESGEGSGLRLASQLQRTNTGAMTDLRLQYSAFADVLAAATAQQAMISGSVIAPYAADELTSYDFGKMHVSCPAVPDNKQNVYNSAQCAAAKKMNEYSWQVASAVRQLEAAGDESAAKAAERTLAELRIKIAGELAEQDKPMEKKGLVGAVFSMVQSLYGRNCIKLTNTDMRETYPAAHQADKAVAEVLQRVTSEATSPEGRSFWNHARLICLMEKNSDFAANVVKVLTLQDKKKRGWNSFGYNAAVTSKGNDALMRSVLEGLPYAWVRTGNGGTWRIEVHDTYGWIETFDLPLTVDINEPVSSETDAHRLLSNLRNRTASKLADLSVCTDGKSSCTEDEMRLMRRVAIGVQPE
jgi:hypothetical protein